MVSKNNIFSKSIFSVLLISVHVLHCTILACLLVRLKPILGQFVRAHFTLTRVDTQLSLTLSLTHSLSLSHTLSLSFSKSLPTTQCCAQFLSHINANRLNLRAQYYKTFLVSKKSSSSRQIPSASQLKLQKRVTNFEAALRPIFSRKCETVLHFGGGSGISRNVFEKNFFSEMFYKIDLLQQNVCQSLKISSLQDRPTVIKYVGK